MTSAITVLAQAAATGLGGNWPVFAGLATTLIAVAGAIAAWRLNNANAAKVLNEMAVGIADKAEKRDEKMYRRIAILETRVEILTDAVMTAIPTLERSDTVDPALAGELRKALQKSRELRLDQANVGEPGGS